MLYILEINVNVLVVGNSSCINFQNHLIIPNTLTNKSYFKMGSIKLEMILGSGGDFINLITWDRNHCAPNYVIKNSR